MSVHKPAKKAVKKPVPKKKPVAKKAEAKTIASVRKPKKKTSKG